MFAPQSPGGRVRSLGLGALSSPLLPNPSSPLEKKGLFGWPFEPAPAIENIKKIMDSFINWYYGTEIFISALTAVERSFGRERGEGQDREQDIT